MYMFSEDLLSASYKFIYGFVFQVIGDKALFRKGFTRNCRDIFI